MRSRSSFLSGIGIDIVENQRIWDMHLQYGDQFLDRILTSEERQEYSHRTESDFRKNLPLWFSIKEAVCKATASIAYPHFEFSHMRMSEIQAMGNLGKKRALGDVLHLSASRTLAKQKSIQLSKKIFFFLSGVQKEKLSVGLVVCFFVQE